MRRYSLEHLLGEDTEELPTDVQGLKHGPVDVAALGDEILLELGQKLKKSRDFMFTSFLISQNHILCNV